MNPNLAVLVGFVLGLGGWIVVLTLAERLAAAKRARHQREFLARLRDTTPPEWGL